MGRCRQAGWRPFPTSCTAAIAAKVSMRTASKDACRLQSGKILDFGPA